ncbi:MAG: GntR family transcriptional regulator [Ginsengibacter sp.]
MRSDSLALKAYNDIRKKIVSQQLAPNTRLKEDEWALKVQVSRMAIREALNRLLGEGLLKVGEKGGYFVKPMRVEDVKQIRELREILEIGAIRLTYKKITAEEIKRLEDICDSFSMMAAEGYTSGACEADIKFHETLMKCAHNNKLFQIYITSHIPLFHEKMGKAMGTIDDHEQTDKEHRLIVKALKTKNLKLAEQTLIAHFARGVSAVLDLD